MFPFAEEQAALCRDRLVIRSVKPMENKKRKKWNGYLGSRPVYDRSCCVFGDFGMLLDTI